MTPYPNLTGNETSVDEDSLGGDPLRVREAKEFDYRNNIVDLTKSLQRCGIGEESNRLLGFLAMEKWCIDGTRTRIFGKISLSSG